MTIRWIALTLAALAITACVEHRPLRNGLTDDAVYLDKAAARWPGTTRASSRSAPT